MASGLRSSQFVRQLCVFANKRGFNNSPGPTDQVTSQCPTGREKRDRELPEMVLGCKHRCVQLTPSFARAQLTSLNTPVHPWLPLFLFKEECRQSAQVMEPVPDLEMAGSCLNGSPRDSFQLGLSAIRNQAANKRVFSSKVGKSRGGQSSGGEVVRSVWHILHLGYLRVNT